MFGKKKKDQQVPQFEEEQVAPQQEMEQPTLEELVEDTRIFFESELINDDEVDYSQEFEAIAYILREEQGEILKAENLDPDPIFNEETNEIEYESEAYDELQDTYDDDAQLEEIIEDEQSIVDEVQEEPQEQEPVVEENSVQESVQEEVEEPIASEPQQEEVVYVVDHHEEEDEVVKPARLVRLPNLIDYMLTQNMSKRMKLNVATLLLSAYQKFKDIPEEKKIIIKCMSKVIQSLMANNNQ